MILCGAGTGRPTPSHPPTPPPPPPPATRIAIIQAENPDGDSLGSSLALEEILGAMGKQVSLHCPVDIPKYLRYLPGWDRVEPELDTQADLIIIVDTTAEVLLSKTLAIPGAFW